MVFRFARNLLTAGKRKAVADIGMRNIAFHLHHGENRKFGNGLRVDGRTPLHFAAVFGQAEVVIALIKAGADINAKDKYGETPLHYSAEQDDIKTALVLIKEGADINTKDKNGNTPLQIAIDEHGKDSTIFAKQTPKKPKRIGFF